LNANWNGGCRNGSELWRRLRAAGYGGSMRVVTEWTTRRRRATRAGADRPGPITTVPPARTIARLLTSERDCKSAEALRIRVAIETASPTIVAARNLLDRIRTMVAAKMPDDLASWIRDAAESELASFAFGIEADEAGESCNRRALVQRKRVMSVLIQVSSKKTSRSDAMRCW